MKNSTKRGALYAFLALTFVVFILFSSEAFEGAKKGIEIAVTLLIPTLFPFFVLSGLFVSTGFAAMLGKCFEPVFRKVFRLPGVCASAFFLGLVCGFPVGAETACTLYGQGSLTREQTERVSAFCSNPSLAFVVSTVGGGLYNNVAVGWLLWGVQTLVSVVFGIVVGRIGSREMSDIAAAKPRADEKPLTVLFCRSLSDGFTATVSVCASVVFFFSLNGIAEKIGLFAVLPYGGLIRGLFEMTNGVQSLAAEGLASLPSVSAVLGWSGLCVLVQLASVMTKHGCRMRRVVCAKALQGVVGALAAYAVMPLVADVSAFAQAGTGCGYVRVSFCAALILVGIILVFCVGTFGKHLDEKRNV